MIEAILGRLAGGETLGLEGMAQCIETVVSGQVPEGQLGLLLTLLHERGETVDEVAGAALALRRQMTRIRTRRQGVLDTCGTGGDGSGTFNISTASALVTAAAGVPVAKHGNRKISSRTGSADVLASLGVQVQAPVAVVEQCLDQLGLCFCFAPLLHDAMKRVAEVRRKLGFPTIFNLLGPLCNPAGAQFQLLGVGKQPLHRLLAEALQRLEVHRALVVHGEDGLDEVTLCGATRVYDVTAETIREFTWHPADFGLAEAPREALLVDGPDESAQAIRQILAGVPGPPRDIVVLNAAAALWLAGRAAALPEAAGLAQRAIDSGAAARLLEQLAACSQDPDRPS